jgi:hypothetical protein
MKAKTCFENFLQKTMLKLVVPQDAINQISVIWHDELCNVEVNTWILHPFGFLPV